MILHEDHSHVSTCDISCSNHHVICISDFSEGGALVLRQRQRNPMLSIEHSLSPPTPSLTTTSSQTTYHRSNSTSLSSASTVSFSCLQIFNKILTLPKSVCCILSDWKEEKEPYLLLQYYNSELLTFTYISILQTYPNVHVAFFQMGRRRRIFRRLLQNCFCFPIARIPNNPDSQSTTS